MRRFLALTSAAALSLFCAACGSDDTDEGQFKNARANVTGTHPVLMTLSVSGVSETPEPSATNLILTEDADNDRLNVDLLFFDCDLTATMTGETTFTVNPGSCVFPLPEEVEMDCDIAFEITGGTGGKASKGAKVGATLNGNYKMTCPELGVPVSMPMTILLVGT
ncbi:hypothetical protein COCOR_04634 [Corallococcus coralloides DSM 2259]|uniref:Lipoprotein n=1 Tax=Corallococcus coralloides (strain ATCC 25202 / DSM 2259 / NBRC 100086 / M2) TaxID=1144275 RepID=H8MI52_CORCM|nr:hypothetical protein [Corallococcus coralloides]AFE05935.1 hypothetical protein COCOR_04634 [Corallococcus coralloides DSM 2259]